MHKQQRKRFHYMKNCIKEHKHRQPHQSVGHGLLMLVEVHEVFVVSCGGKNSECWEHGEQEAPGVACTVKHRQT